MVGTVCIGTFIGQVDGSIVQLALPSLEDAFGAPLDAVSWVALGYMLAFASVLPVFARLAEIAGRKTLYLAGFALFGLWSALCGLAPTLPVADRLPHPPGHERRNAGRQQRRDPGRRRRSGAARQGFRDHGGGAGGRLEHRPGARRRALGDALGWRSIFWVTVPFAVLGTALGWLIVPRSEGVAGDVASTRRARSCSFPRSQPSSSRSPNGQAWGLSTPLIACAIAAPLLFGGFIWRESRAPAPLVDLSLFRSAAFSAGSVGVLVSYAMLYGMFFAMSFALVRGYHDQPLAAGLRLTIVPVALGLVAPISGALSDKRPRLLMLVRHGALRRRRRWRSRCCSTERRASLPGVMVGLAAFGAGLGLYIAPNNNATMSAAPADKSGVAGGLLNLLRVSGGA